MAPYVGWAKRIKSGFFDTCFLFVEGYFMRSPLVHCEFVRKLRSSVNFGLIGSISSVLKKSKYNQTTVLLAMIA
jgi:hypothetical protein